MKLATLWVLARDRVRLPEHAIRVGVKVARDDPDSPASEVLAITGKSVRLRKVRNSDGSVLSAAQAAELRDETAPISAIVVVADFGEPVFPGLRHLDSIERGGNNPAHVVIKGENHHVLEALQFTHAGKIDCIYIDPPYNSGARDWKYDNNYVDETDEATLKKSGHSVLISKVKVSDGKVTTITQTSPHGAAPVNNTLVYEKQ